MKTRLPEGKKQDEYHCSLCGRTVKNIQVRGFSVICPYCGQIL